MLFFINVICNGHLGNPTDDQMPMPGSIEGVNILGLITLSIAFGLVLGRMENEGKPLRDFFRCLNEASMHLISIAIW